MNDATFFARHDKTPNVKPLCIIWWQTLDSNQNAVIGHEDGSISFVSLTDGQNIGLCNIASPVQSLNICQDNHLDSVTLLVSIHKYNNSKGSRKWENVVDNKLQSSAMALIAGAKIYSISLVS